VLHCFHTLTPHSANSLLSIHPKFVSSRFISASLPCNHPSTFSTDVARGILVCCCIPFYYTYPSLYQDSLIRSLFSCNCTFLSLSLSDTDHQNFAPSLVQSPNFYACVPCPVAFPTYQLPVSILFLFYTLFMAIYTSLCLIFPPHTSQIFSLRTFRFYKVLVRFTPNTHLVYFSYPSSNFSCSVHPHISTPDIVTFFTKFSNILLVSFTPHISSTTLFAFSLARLREAPSLFALKIYPKYFILVYFLHPLDQTLL
jgi:hypothetical protein